MEEFIEKEEESLREAFKKIERIRYNNFKRVIEAFRLYKVREMDFYDSTGYGFYDTGRDKLEKIFSLVFGTEDSLVRSQIASGSHAISIALFGILKKGDEILSITGRPYDTIERTIGLKPSPLSLKDFGVSYREVNIFKGDVDFKKVLRDETKVIFIQKSMGYTKGRRTLLNREIGELVKKIKSVKDDVIVFVDNCYGEFVEENEPTHFGVDIIAGSLTKNPGGGIAPFGGYIAGRKDLIERCSSLLSSPGIGKEGGAQISFKRNAFLGLFLSPHIVGEALKGIILSSKVLEDMGFKVFPKWNEERGDIILGIEFGEREKLMKFAQLVQNYSPIDSDAILEPMREDFFNEEIVMAAGTFTQGSSIELSFDAPLSPPYIGYLQGGLTYEHIKYALINILKEI
ncbi:MAG: methionine gamma-lyase family protein [Caldisericia bacterium]|nr:methionine gamma-lyase family protein [Caldisericia bacterium]